MINIQPIEKRSYTTYGSLFVNSIFKTIQGEGPFAGRPAIFIRLAGCNLQCPNCDTEYTKRTLIEAGEIVGLIHNLNKPPHLVVITGGEPFRQNLTPLVLCLVDNNYQVQIETNGTLAPPPGMPGVKQNCFIVVSPKTAKVNSQVAKLAVAWKYVLSADSCSPTDGLPMKVLNHSNGNQVARPPKDFPLASIYLQPADLKSTELNSLNLEAVKKSCIMYGYTLQLQIHKLIGME